LSAQRRAFRDERMRLVALKREHPDTFEQAFGRGRAHEHESDHSKGQEPVQVICGSPKVNPLERRFVDCMQSTSANRDFWFKLVAAVMVGAAFFAVMPLQRMLRAENDFVHWYVGGALFGTPDLHLEAPNHALQTKLIGGVLDHSYFIRPTFYGLLLKPLSWMPYLTSYVVFQIFSVFGCLLYFLRTFGRQWQDIWVYAAMSIPLISNIVNGQDVTLLLGICTLSLVLARKDRDFLSGLVFTLCAIKFHLFIFTPIAMLAQKRWKMFGGGVTGAILLFVLGLLGGGWTVFMSLVALLSKPENHPYPELMPNLRGMVQALTGGSSQPIAFTLALFVAAAVVFLMCKADNYEKAFAYAIIGGLLVNFHAYIQDPMLLLLAAAILFDGQESVEFRTTLQLALFPVAYVLLMWQPPYSAAYAIIVLSALGFAVRDRLRQPATVLNTAAI